MIFFGRVISEAARFRATQAVSFRSLQSEEALLVVTGGSPSASETRRIDARLLQYGDRFKVLPHTSIVTDGKVKYGGSEVDESMVTGESIPVAKGYDSVVYAGTNNGSGTLIVALTALPHENSINKIATMIEDAKLTKPKTQALADRVAGWFVPLAAAVGTLVFLVQLLVGYYHSRQSWQTAVVNSMTYSIATLIVSCPCAISLAVPMVILIASGVSARFGIIFKDPQKLELARNVTDVVFDKTGTLTAGLLTVENVRFYNGSATEATRMLLGLLDGIHHPVSAAVYQYVKRRAIEDARIGFRPVEIFEIKSIASNGVVGTCKENGVEIRAGSPQWLGVEALDADYTLLCMTVSGIHRATFRLKDQIRHAATPVIKYLQSRQINIHLLSGDNTGAVNAIAFLLQIPSSNVQSRLKPEEKQKYLQDLQNNKKIVMFVGDGTNDAVALKQADVGVHLNHGSDTAKSAADVVLMNPELYDILTLLDISKAAYRRIVLNFAWSAMYNVVAILMAAGAFVKIRIEPAYAGLGELASVLPVVLIAFQMKWQEYGLRHGERKQRSL